VNVLAIAEYAKKDRPIVPMLTDTVRRMGIESVLIRGANARMLDADVLLIAGDCRKFDDYWHMLRKAPRRPFTILWQFEPLPAPEMAPAMLPQLLSLGRSRHLADRGGVWKAVQRTLVFPNRIVDIARDAKVRRIKAAAARTANLDIELMSTHELCRHAEIFERLNCLHSEDLIDAVAVSVRSRRDFLTRVGIPSTFIPIGWHPLWGHDLGRKRDIDVLFLGIVDDRRRPILEAVKAMLNANGFSFMNIEEGCAGREREELLSRTRISLDIPRIPWEMAGMRFLMSMGCGAMVISSWEGDSAPYIAGRHLVCASAGNFASTVEHYLRNEDQRLRIAGDGHAFVTGELTMDRSLRDVLAMAAGQHVGQEVHV
jgi:hypothetical protein